MTTSRQDASFAEHLFGDTEWLEKAIDWINANLDPSDVFHEDKLKQWAENNGECEWD